LQMISPVSLGRARWIAITSCTFIAITVFAAPKQTANTLTQIRSVLQAQQDGWNRGDIDGFMNGYARSASTVFISEDTIRRCWQTTSRTAGLPSFSNASRKAGELCTIIQARLRRRSNSLKSYNVKTAFLFNFVTPLTF